MYVPGSTVIRLPFVQPCPYVRTDKINSINQSINQQGQEHFIFHTHTVCTVQYSMRVHVSVISALLLLGDYTISRVSIYVDVIKSHLLTPAMGTTHICAQHTHTHLLPVGHVCDGIHMHTHNQALAHEQTLLSHTYAPHKTQSLRTLYSLSIFPHLAIR